VQHSHFQQDSHEFLLNLVTEFEKELVETVQGVTKKIEEESQSSPQMQKSSLLNFFSNRPKTAGNRQEKDTSSDSEQELICRLPPAKCEPDVDLQKLRIQSEAGRNIL